MCVCVYLCVCLCVWLGFLYSYIMDVTQRGQGLEGMGMANLQCAIVP